MKRQRVAWPGWTLALLFVLLSSGAQALNLFERFGNTGQPRILDAEQAFQVIINVVDPLTLEARWTIAPGYYLYRDKFRLSVLDTSDPSIASSELPPGEIKEDPYFGRQAVFHGEAVLRAHLQRTPGPARELRLKADYQGCAEIGVCYPPLSTTLTVNLPELTTAPVTRAAPGVIRAAASETPETTAVPAAAVPAAPTATDEAEQDRLARLLGEQRLLAIPAFFGLGLLLAFTPCVFPMIPILSSLIAGEGSTLTRRRALALALVYVLAMALTYTGAGLLAALLGQNLQAAFQNTWILSAFSALFVALALAMFGFYELQLPTGLQQRLTAWSNRQRGGRYLGVAVMGVLSALIVGPCVAPPLIGVLSFIAVTGDVALGALALFVLSLGMGAPLLLIGASAGHWLPRAGHWMERIKAVFGVLLLALALWLLERILPAALMMLLWATLLIVTATYMGALQPLVHGAPPWRTLIKGLGVVLLIYGMLLLVGVAAGGRDPWQPLRGVSFSAAAQPTAATFRPIKTRADLEQALRTAAGRPVMLDFYADWCVSCKDMERDTFSAAEVRALLADRVVLQADVTAHDADDQALLRHFGLIGPPGILFFDRQGHERRADRVVGFMNAADFAAHLRRMDKARS